MEKLYLTTHLGQSPRPPCTLARCGPKLVLAFSVEFRDLFLGGDELSDSESVPESEEESDLVFVPQLGLNLGQARVQAQAQAKA